MSGEESTGAVSHLTRAREKIPAFTGFVLFYTVTGLATGLISGDFYLGAEYLTAWVLVWPLFLFNPDHWLAMFIGLVTANGVLSLFDRSSISISTPKRLPSLSTRRFGTFVGTLGVAETISRVAAGGFFVLYMFLTPKFQGEATLSANSLATYYWEGTEVIGIRWGGAHITMVSRTLPDAPAIVTGDPVIAKVLIQVGDAQFFGGVAFAIFFGFITTLPVAYVTVRSGWRVYDHYAGE